MEWRLSTLSQRNVPTIGYDVCVVGQTLSYDKSSLAACPPACPARPEGGGLGQHGGLGSEGLEGSSVGSLVRGGRVGRANIRVLTDALYHSQMQHYFSPNLYGRAPRGPMGVKKSHFFSQMKLFSFCAKIALKM